MPSDKWSLYRMLPPSRYIHVVPSPERDEHRVEIDPACWCEPTIEPFHDGAVVLHRDAIARRLGLSAKVLAENARCA